MNRRRVALLGALSIFVVLAGWLVLGAVRDEGPTEAAVVWALVDTVPAQQKSGVFVRTGLDYEPILDADRSQAQARLTLTAADAMFAIAPERNDSVTFDAIELDGLVAPAEGVETWPFVIDVGGALTVFVPEGSLDDCRVAFEGEEPFAPYGLVGDIAGRFAVSATDCLVSTPQEGGLLGSLPSPMAGVGSFGLLFSLPDVTDAGSLAPVTLTALALTNSAERIGSDPGDLTVEISNRDLALAARTTDPGDDGPLGLLHVLDGEGTRATVPVNDDGTFTIDTADLSPRVKVWFDDYGLEHYPAQGPWIDTSRLTRELTIDLAPVFVPTGEPPPPSPQNRNPHELRTWNGSTNMAVQEYAGLTFTNNYGRADRDRDPDNPNDCHRVAYLGGSYVETVQTRIDQKPGIIAEALLATRHDRCVEVFTVGRSRFNVESHYANAVSLVEDFGVDHLVFNMSGGELCRMDDVAYEMANGVARDTPTTWRYVDGRFVEPALRTETVEVEVDPDFERSVYCDFLPDKDDLTVERALFEKLAALHGEFSALGDGVDVTFFLMKDALADTARRLERLDFLEELCDEYALPCVALEPPELFKPEELRDDLSPYLLRYLGDGHPNERANQYTAEALAAIIESSLPVATEE